MNEHVTELATTALEAGVMYVTRDGRKAFCIGISPWISATPAAVGIEGRKCIESYSIDGRFRGGNYGSKGSHSLDLVGTYRPPVKAWAALRPDGTVFDFFDAEPTGDIARDYRIVQLREVTETETCK